MTTESEDEQRRRLARLQSDFEKSEIERKADKEIQEKNMQILESNLKELLADNRIAFEQLQGAFERLQGEFEKLRTGMVMAVFGGIVASVTILGGIIAILAFLLQPGG